MRRKAVHFDANIGVELEGDHSRSVAGEGQGELRGVGEIGKDRSRANSCFRSVGELSISGRVDFSLFFSGSRLKADWNWPL